MDVKRKKYTEEFKQEAISLANQIGLSKAGADLGINPVNIRRWKSESGPKKVENSIDFEKECRRLRKENMYLKKINEVLKKSTAIFSMDHMQDSK